MPSYDYSCSACGTSQEETHGMNDTPDIRCSCGRPMTKLICLIMPLTHVGHDWSGENGGRGRMINQLADRPGDPSAYCLSQRDAIDKAKKKFPEAVIQTA